MAADNAGFDGVWTWDHVMGGVHRARHVLECWTVLSALAAVTQRAAIGPMTLNVANRHPGLVAVMAATLQQVSGGRLLLGLGAGGGMNTPYAAEQAAFNRPVPTDAVRRSQVEEAVDVFRQVWSRVLDADKLPSCGAATEQWQLTASRAKRRLPRSGSRGAAPEGPMGEDPSD